MILLKKPKNDFLENVQVIDFCDFLLIKPIKAHQL